VLLFCRLLHEISFSFATFFNVLSLICAIGSFGELATPAPISTPKLLAIAALLILSILVHLLLIRFTFCLIVQTS
jgi:hypothetical protein